MGLSNIYLHVVYEQQSIVRAEEDVTPCTVHALDGLFHGDMVHRLRRVNVVTFQATVQRAAVQQR